MDLFLHVDDGLLIGPSRAVQPLIEQFSGSVMIRSVGRHETLNGRIFFLGKDDRKNRSWVLGGCEYVVHSRFDWSVKVRLLESIYNTERQAHAHD